MSVARTWGSTDAERQAPYPCDRFVGPDPDQAFRAVDVAAPADVVFRWLCQLKVAPYSYDLIDNFGRRSSRTLTPGADQLELGQRFMTIFELVDFESGSELTLVSRANKLFGDVGVTYRVVPTASGCRLIVKLAVRHPRARTALYRRVGPPLDLIMMRKQLLTLKQLAERDHGLLPYIDTNEVLVEASPERVWPLLWSVLSRTIGGGELARRYAKLIGTRDLDSPILGFHVVAEIEPRELALAGAHRFSEYTLTIELEDLSDGRTRLKAITRAKFPGVQGQLYKTLVIRSRLHVLATRSILKAIKRRAERPQR